jgi:hypothetical protein
MTSLAFVSAQPPTASGCEDRRSGVDWDRGDLQSGIRHFEARAKHYRELGDRPGEAEALHLLGENLRDLGRLDEAETVLVEGLIAVRYFRQPESVLSGPLRLLPEKCGGATQTICNQRENVVFAGILRPAATQRRAISC